MGVGLEWVRDSTSGEWSLVVRNAEPPPIPRGLEIFPPLFFVPFADSTSLANNRRALNANHPFSRWLIDRAPVLHQTVPGLLLALRRALTDYYHGNPAKAVNAVLDRFREIEPMNAPTRSVSVKPKDFELYGQI
jgi:hypothetical protein